MTDAVFNIENLREDVDIEAKRAGGRDGKGALPMDMWETFSAFANTDGGIILPGVSEKSGIFENTGVAEPDRMIHEFWTQLNNPQKDTLSNRIMKAKPTAAWNKVFPKGTDSFATQRGIAK